MTNGPTEAKQNPGHLSRAERRRERRKLKKALKRQQRADAQAVAASAPGGGGGGGGGPIVVQTKPTPRTQYAAPGGLGGYPTKQQLTRFAASIVWPAQTGVPAVRYSDPGQTTPTALGRPWTQIEAPWGNVDETETLSFQTFRSSARAYAIDFPKNTKDYLYDVYGTDTSADTSDPPKLIPTISIAAESKQDFHGPYAVAESGGGLFAPHTEKVFAGFPGNPSRSVRYFWMEAGTAISGAFTLESAGLDKVVNIYLEKWSFTDSFESEQIGSFTVDSGVLQPFSGTVDTEGWYGLSFQNAGDTVIEITAQWSFGGNGAVLGQRSLPFLLSRLEEIEQYHVTSVAGRYENTAAPNFRAGKVAVYQVPAQQDNFQFIRNFDRVAQASGAWSEEATEGSYGWLRPVDKAKEMTLASEFRIVNGVIYDSFWDMTLPVQYKAFSVRVPAQTTTGGNPKSGTWWFYANIEYITESPWPEKNIPSKDYQAYDKAINALADVPGASTNKSHLKLLDGYVKKIANMFSTPQKALRNGTRILKDVYDTAVDVAN